MPVKTNRNNKKNNSNKADCWCGDVRAVNKHYVGEFVKKLFITLTLVLLAYSVIWFGTLIRNNVKAYNYIGLADRSERSITLSAVGEAEVSPDIARINLGMISEGDSVEEAQAANTVVMNALVTGLKELGIDETDIQSADYYVYPVYNHTDEPENMIAGYGVEQSAAVKIRDLDMVDRVVAFSSEVGVNSVGGLEFTIDDNEAYLAEARMDALEKIYKEAKVLSRALGVRMVDIISYDEYNMGDNSFAGRSAMALDESVLFGEVPTIEPGTTEVKLDVSVTFEIR
jgi:uncharacterized protein